MWVATVTKLYAIIDRIYQQAKVDIFIIDHEKHNKSTKQVNAWRRIFLANEWNELSSANKMVSPFTTFVWFLFFWLGLGW